VSHASSSCAPRRTPRSPSTTPRARETRFAQRLAAVGALADAAREVEPVPPIRWRAAAFELWKRRRRRACAHRAGGVVRAAEELAGALADVAALVPASSRARPKQLKALGRGSRARSRVAAPVPSC